MTKTPYIRVFKRINTALMLLRRNISPARVGRLLVQRYGISGRQAYRYILQAQELKEPLPIPEKKIVFTVKLPVRLVERLRQLAKSKKESLSVILTNALEQFFKRIKNGR